MLPWKTIISIDKFSEVPVFLQVTNAVIRSIKVGMIKSGTRMPGTRIMADALEINRQTVVKSYDELYSQGWIHSVQSKGTFVSDHLPEVAPRRFKVEDSGKGIASATGFTFKINTVVHKPAKPGRDVSGFHDGPDVRLTPADLIGRSYKSILKRKTSLLLMSYSEVEGRQQIREAISEYLNSTRGLQTRGENIILTRGAQMAIFLLAMILISRDDTVITAEIGYRYADLVFLYAGAVLQRVPVDENGLDIDAIEKICMKKKVRAVYVTPHHHYPTTVMLSAARRMKLLQLSEKYGFIIIEDDYDYEFHYESSPILPLASADRCGMVVYIGSFSKSISPAIRVGYVAAPANLIAELGKMRQIVDAQGDAIVEQVLAEFIADGEIRRHMKKSLRIYRQRRDFMCKALKEISGDIIDFKIPEGGLAIWAKYDKRISVPELSDKLLSRGIVLSKGLLHDKTAGKKLNSTRMGFGWMNREETEHAVEVLGEMIRKWK